MGTTVKSMALVLQVQALRSTIVGAQVSWSYGDGQHRGLHTVVGTKSVSDPQDGQRMVAPPRNAVWFGL